MDFPSNPFDDVIHFLNGSRSIPKLGTSKEKLLARYDVSGFSKKTPNLSDTTNVLRHLHPSFINRKMRRGLKRLYEGSTKTPRCL